MSSFEVTKKHLRTNVQATERWNCNKRKYCDWRTQLVLWTPKWEDVSSKYNVSYGGTISYIIIIRLTELENKVNMLIKAFEESDYKIQSVENHIKSRGTISYIIIYAMVNHFQNALNHLAANHSTFFSIWPKRLILEDKFLKFKSKRLSEVLWKPFEYLFIVISKK